MDQVRARDLADRIVDYLLTDVRSQAVTAYLKTAVDGLRLVRDPWEKDLPTEQLREVLRFWQSLPRIDGIPNLAEVEPEAVSSAQGYLMLIDIDDENDDFRYTLYGSNIARVSGFDVTGQSVWQLATTSRNQIFFAACYSAARRLKRPIYTVHEAPPFMKASHWHRLILPLGLDGEIKRFLVCNVPMLDGEVL